jgi:hypothetical protein
MQPAEPGQALGASRPTRHSSRQVVSPWLNVRSARELGWQRQSNSGTSAPTRLDADKVPSRNTDCPEVFSRCLESSNNLWPDKALLCSEGFFSPPRNRGLRQLRPVRMPDGAFSRSRAILGRLTTGVRYGGSSSREGCACQSPNGASSARAMLAGALSPPHAYDGYLTYFRSFQRPAIGELG